MNDRRSDARSPYMEWAKLCSACRHNLATSGMGSLPLADLGTKVEKLEINGPGGYGYEPLLQAIAQRYRVPRESVVSAIGTSMANYLALAAASEPGDEILIEQPAYGPLVDVAIYLGARVKRFERKFEDEFAIDPVGGRGAFQNHQEDALREIAALARRSGAYVLVDEVYLEMLFEAEPQTAFHIDPELFVITNSLTKAYGLSGVRCGWVFARPDVAERMWHINDLHGVNFAHPAELLSVIAFEKLPAIAARMKSLLDENRKLLRRFLDSRGDLNCFWPEYGTMAFPRLRNGDVEQLCEFLRDEFDTSVVPGRFFGAPAHFRLGIGGATESVRDALEQLGKGLAVFAASPAAAASQAS